MSDGGEESQQQAKGGASAALRGFDYQADVSILAALRIIFVSKSAGRVILEPANADDFQAELAPDDPGPFRAGADIAGTEKLIIQVKFRNGEPWSVSDLDRLLSHGTRRKSAWELLEDTCARYLLVTNAALKGEALGLEVDDFEDRTDAATFPKSLANGKSVDVSGRVAVYAGLTRTLLTYHLTHVLTEVLRVPAARQAQCLATLRAEALLRMRGNGPGVWTQQELAGTIRAHGGYLASSADLDVFVPSENFNAIQAVLDSRNAVVICGASGTGKTTAALALCDRALRKNGAMELVVVNPNDDPSLVRPITISTPRICYIEDPWGQYSLRSGSQAWTEQLPGMLHHASADCRYVVTSRSDVMHRALAEDPFKAWMIGLEASDYQNGPLRQIYDRRASLLPPERHGQALDFCGSVLAELETPFEIDHYFATLAIGPSETETNDAFLKRLIATAHRNAVEHVVRQHLHDWGSPGQAVVIWALLASRGSFDRSHLGSLQKALRSDFADLAGGLDRLVDRLVATRHLRQPLRTVAFAHPSVRAGFEAFLLESRFETETVLGQVVTALTRVSGQNRYWSLETAARLIEESPRLLREDDATDALEIDLSPETHASIDAWLEETLLSTPQFPRALELARAVGSPASCPSELARWLLTTVKRGAAHFIDHWKAPEYPPEWYDRVRADPRSRRIAERFIREMLPDEHGSYGAGFPARLDRIVDGLTPAYRDAALLLAGHGFNSSVDPIAAGAVRDLDGFAPVLLKCLDYLQEPPEARAARHEQWRQAEDGELDSAAQEYIETYDHDEGHCALALVEAYVEAARSAGEWRRLADHPRAPELAPSWSRDVRRGDAPPSDDELFALLAATQRADIEAEFWLAVRRHWSPSFAGKLRQTVVATENGPHLRSAAITCAYAACPTLLCECVSEARDDSVLWVEIVRQIPSAARQVSKKVNQNAIKILRRQLDRDAIDLARLLDSAANSRVRLASDMCDLLERVSETGGADLLAQIVPLLVREGRKPFGAVRKWLRNASSSEDAHAAAECARQLGDDEAMDIALGHPRADARQVALAYFAQKCEGALPPKLLRLANDPGHRVRMTLLERLLTRQDPAHLQTLLILTQDRWSNADYHSQEDETFPIARAAVEALCAYAPLSDAIGNELIELGRLTPDRGLRATAFNVAAHDCGSAISDRLWAVSQGSDKGVIRLDALDAMVFAPAIGPDILSLLTADAIMQMPLPLAVSATALLCIHAPVSQAARTSLTIGQRTAWRSMVLLAAWLLEDRDRTAATGLLNLLPDNHPGRSLIAEGEVLLPAHVLDDLGHIRVRRAVAKRLSNVIAGQ